MLLEHKPIVSPNFPWGERERGREKEKEREREREREGGKSQVLLVLVQFCSSIHTVCLAWLSAGFRHAGGYYSLSTGAGPGVKRRVPLT